MSGIIIFLVSPVPDKNKPLEKIEYKVFKRRSRQILAIEVLLFVVSILTKWNTIAECVSLSLGLVAVMLVMGRKNKGSGFI